MLPLVVSGWTGRRVPSPAGPRRALGGFTPALREMVAEDGEHGEQRDAQQAREEQRGEHQVGALLELVDAELASEPGLGRVAGPEEELTDDGADHGEAGGDAQAGEDRREGGRQLELAQTGPAAGLLEREEV